MPAGHNAPRICGGGRRAAPVGSEFKIPVGRSEFIDQALITEFYNTGPREYGSTLPVFCIGLFFRN